MDIVATNLQTAFDEKKDDGMSEEIPSSPPRFMGTLSPSKRRAKNASSAGLSELSKQQRILQAKNEAQAIEINRLERQLKILAELQGISVADLRKALEDACANEAFEELQHRVKKLRFDLEAATLAKQKEMGQDMAAPHIANLELRIGELEEVEQKHEKEVMDLYDQLRHEKSRATRLEAEGAQYKKDAEDYLSRLNKEMEKSAKLEANFQEQLRKHQLEQSRKMQELAKIAKEAEAAAKNRAGMDANGNGIGGYGPDGQTNGMNGSEGMYGGQGGVNGVTGENGAGRSGMGGTGANGDGRANGSRGMTSLNAVGADDMGSGNYSGSHMGFNPDGSRALGSIPMGTSHAITPGMAEEYERMVKLLKEKDDAILELEARIKAEREKWMRDMKDNEGRALESITKLQMEKDQMALTIKQLRDTESQNDLRLAQFRARFAVQDERINDMEQQLSSLYVAFGLLKEDQDAEDRKRAALENNLNLADAEFAKHVNNSQKKRDEEKRKARNAQLPSSVTDPWNVSGRRNMPPQSPIIDPWNATAQHPGTSPGHRSSTNDSIPQTITTPPVHERSGSFRSPNSPYSNDYAREYEQGHLLATPQLGEAAVSTPDRAYASTPAAATPGTWKLIFPEPRTTRTKSYATSASPGENGLLIRGMLIVKSKSLMRKWKSKHSKLYLQGNHYQWDMEGKSYMLGFGISKVEFYPNHPLSFTVYTNPFDEMAPVIHAATSTEEDYHRWMAALTKATTGGSYEAPQMEGSPRRSREELSANGRPSFQSPGDETIISALSIEDQEAADLNRALRLSQTMT